MITMKPLFNMKSRKVILWVVAALLLSMLFWALAPLVRRLPPLRYDSLTLAELREWQVKRTAGRVPKTNPAERGRILDVNGTVLVRPGKRFVLWADPSLLAASSDRRYLPELARLVGMNEAVLQKQLATGPRHHLRLIPDLPPATAEAILRMNLKGISVMTVPTREYPAAAPLAHLIGFVRSGEQAIDFRGVCGVEMLHNIYLTAGVDACLTLDHGLQLAIQKIAEAAAVETRATQVQIIVMNPRTGAIRAAVQVPSAHGSGNSSVSNREYWWGALIESHEPGGLIRPLVIASALDIGVLGPDTPIFCENGTWQHQGLPLHDAAPFGDLTAAQVLVHSSNIGMGKIGVMMGERPLYDALVGWELNRKCSVGFIGASSGMILPVAWWSKHEITRIPNGYASSSTLLHLLRAYTVFFNDGGMTEPTLIEPDAPPPPKQILKPETARWMRDTMTQAVESGTGHLARIEGLPIAGKTSIVQKLIPNRRAYSTDKIEASFIGGFEHAGTPSLIVVWLDEPQRNGQQNPAATAFRKTALMMTGGSGK